MRNLSKKGTLKLRRSIIPLTFQFLLYAVPVYIVFQLLILIKIHHTGVPLPSPEILVNLYRICCIFFIIELSRRYFDDLYIFGHKRVIHLKGCLSLHHSKTSIDYSDIREVDVEQSLPARAIGYGTLRMGTASSEEMEIVFKDIPLSRVLARYVQQIIASKRKTTPQPIRGD